MCRVSFHALHHPAANPFRKPENRSKSRSKVPRVAPCSMAMAAKCASLTRFPPRPTPFRRRPSRAAWRSVGPMTRARGHSSITPSAVSSDKAVEANAPLAAQTQKPGQRMQGKSNSGRIGEAVFEPAGRGRTLWRVEIDRVHKHVDIRCPHFGSQPWSMSSSSSASANALVRSTSGLPI